MSIVLRNLVLLTFFHFSTACFKYNWTDTECGLYGDPHIRAFSGARGTIFLPCRFHAAQLFMNSPPSGICFTNILVFGVVRGKGVYTGGAEIHIILISNSHLKHSLQIVISDGLLKITGGLDPMPSITWGTSNQMQLGPLVITWTFNGPYVTLSAPLCGLTLVYRTLSLRPSGIIIQAATRQSLAYAGYHKYVFCGNRTDVETMFEDDGMSLDLNTIDQVLAYRILSPSLSQQLLIPSLTGQLHPNRGACEQASKMFRGCSSEDKIRAIKICLFIFTKRLLLKCFSDSGATTPMIVFNTCISVVCNPSGVYCDSFKTAVRPCILTVNKPPKLLSLMYNSTDCSTPTK